MLVLWMQDIYLRRQHAMHFPERCFLIGWVDIRDRSFEQQCYRASGLNLITAAIILWNTIYLDKS